MSWNLKEKQEGNTLALRGFLFQADNGSWILSEEPDLKKCCIQADHKQESQIVLLGDLCKYSTNLPLHVRGTFHMQRNGSYSLSDLEIKQKQSFPFWTVGALVCVLLLGFKLKRLLLP